MSTRDLTTNPIDLAPQGVARLLGEIEALALDPTLGGDEVSLRLAQYEACALAEGCPELAFDPIARRLTRAVAPLHGDDLRWSRWARCATAFFAALRAAR